jgi:branched-chain amino acid transport system substrate-binding protein
MRNLFIGAWIAALCVAAGAQTLQTPLRIGVIGPLSGPSSDFGVPMLQGIELAVEEINAVGGYLGRAI